MLHTATLHTAGPPYLLSPPYLGLGFHLLPMASACFSSVNGSVAPAPSRSESRPWRTSLLYSPRLIQSLARLELRPLSLSYASSKRSLHRSSPLRARAELSIEEVQALDSASEDGDASLGGAPVSEDYKLYVGNLPWSCTSEELADVFQKVGSVEMVEVIYDRESGRSRGFGFVSMSSLEDANAAIEKLDGSDYAGRTLRVNFPNRSRNDSTPPPPPRRFDNNVNKLFVGNLAWSVDNETLRDVFSEYGSVVEARVVNDRETGRSRGFGFVTMSSEEEVNEALNKLDGANVEGRNLRVNLAGERPSRGDLY